MLQTIAVIVTGVEALNTGGVYDVDCPLVGLKVLPAILLFHVKLMSEEQLLRVKIAGSPELAVFELEVRLSQEGGGVLDDIARIIAIIKKTTNIITKSGTQTSFVPAAVLATSATFLAFFKYPTICFACLTLL